MPRREPRKAHDERCIFQAFLEAHPSFASQVQTILQPEEDDERDLETVQIDNTRVRWQLGECLKPDQMAAAKQLEQLEAAIMDAIGEQGPNNTRHIRFCMLSLSRAVRRFNLSDAGNFRAELMRIIEDVDTRWAQNPFWWSPAGYHCRTFKAYPTLGKYVASLYFDPRVVRGKRREWPSNQPWIVLESWGGPYNPQTALDSLACFLKQKIGHYGLFGEADVRLIVFYNRAALYNTPFQGQASRTFKDVAAFAARTLEEIRVPFKKVYLLNALHPEPEAFEVYPRLRKCN